MEIVGWLFYTVLSSTVLYFAVLCDLLFKLRGVYIPDHGAERAKDDKSLLRMKCLVSALPGGLFSGDLKPSTL